MGDEQQQRCEPASIAIEAQRSIKLRTGDLRSAKVEPDRLMELSTQRTSSAASRRPASMAAASTSKVLMRCAAASSTPLVWTAVALPRRHFASTSLIAATGRKPGQSMPARSARVSAEVMYDTGVAPTGPRSAQSGVRRKRAGADGQVRLLLSSASFTHR